MRYIAIQKVIDTVKEDLLELMDRKSPYSKAAVCYIRCFRDRRWVEQLIVGPESDGIKTVKAH